MLNETWEDQYRRMHRSLAKLRQAGEETSTPDIDPRDVLTTFCADALSLMYAIQKTSVTDDVRELIFRDREGEDWSLALAICTDIANGAKHHGNTQKSAVTGRKEGWGQIKGRKIRRVMGQQWGEAPRTPGYSTAEWTIEADGADYQAIAIAEQAVADWDRWLRNHGLTPPTP